MMRFGDAAASGASQPRAAHVFQRERHRSRTTCEFLYQSYLGPRFRLNTQVFLVHTREQQGWERENACFNQNMPIFPFKHG